MIFIHMHLNMNTYDAYACIHTPIMTVFNLFNNKLTLLNRITCMSHGSKRKRHRKATQEKLANVKEIKCLNSSQVCQFLSNSNSSGPILRMSKLTGKDFKSFHGWLILEQTGTLYPEYSEWGLLPLEWTKIMLSLTQDLGHGKQGGGGRRVVECLQAHSEPKWRNQLKSKIQWRDNNETLSDMDGK